MNCFHDWYWLFGNLLSFVCIKTNTQRFEIMDHVIKYIEYDKYGKNHASFGLSWTTETKNSSLRREPKCKIRPEQSK